jgi:hypothetical protein
MAFSLGKSDTLLKQCGMTLHQALSTAKTEEDVKDKCINALGLALALYCC